MRTHDTTQSTESITSHQADSDSSRSRRGFLKKTASLGILGMTGAATISGTASAQKFSWPVYSRGDPLSISIRTINYLLTAHGYDVPITGEFGAATEDAVFTFQRAQNLTYIDGIVGPETWSALTPLRSRGDRGMAVRAIQDLFQHAYNRDWLVVDGIYGPNTEMVVDNFQDHYNLLQDGIVGPQTWRALVAAWPTWSP